MVAPLGRRSERKSLQVRNKTYFDPVNMRNCGKRNVRKHKEFKKGDESVTDQNKYEILEISDKFGILDMMETTSSESKANLSEISKISYSFLFVTLSSPF